MSTTVHRFNLPLETESALRDFVTVCFGVRIPNRVVVPGHSTPWRAFCDSYFARHRVVVWEASRGFGGKSFLLALLSLVEALTLKADVKLLGGSFEQAKRVQDYITGFYEFERAPKYLWDGEPLTTRHRFMWGNSIEALTASQRSVRGPHPQRLRGDEVDEMDVDLLNAAMGQAMSKFKDGEITIGAQTTLSSTHHRPDGTMTEVKRRARENGWPIHLWGYHETSAEGGWLPQEEVDAKRGEIIAAMWSVEFDLNEPVAEGRAILTESVEAMFDRHLGEYEGRLGEYVQIQRPKPGGRYATGADWAKKQDFTVITTKRIDWEPRQLIVAWERRQREPWPRMVGRFDKRCSRYRGSAAHDETGVGNVVHDYMKTNAKGIMMVGNTRKNLFTEYIAAIEDGVYQAPYIKWMYDEHKYASVDALFGSGHPPDSIVSGAMMHRAGSRRGGGRGT